MQDKARRRALIHIAGKASEIWVSGLYLCLYINRLFTIFLIHDNLMLRYRCYIFFYNKRNGVIFMAKTGNEPKKTLGNPIPLRLDKSTENMIEAIAKQRGESNQEVMRRILAKGAADELLLTFGADRLLELVRNAVHDELKPAEERMAKLSAKSAIAAATAMYTNIEVLGQLGRSDIRTVYEKARSKAVSYVKTPMESGQTDKSIPDGDENE